MRQAIEEIPTRQLGSIWDIIEINYNYILISFMTRWHFFLQSWYQFWSILQTLNRQTELCRLMEWAYKKRLRGPFRLYIQHSLEEEKRLAYFTIRYPRLLKLACFLHFISCSISPTPRYPAKGSASYYRCQR